MAEWLGDGLQNRIHGFNSHSRLQFLQTARQRFVKNQCVQSPQVTHLSLTCQHAQQHPPKADFLSSEPIAYSLSVITGKQSSLQNTVSSVHFKQWMLSPILRQAHLGKWHFRIFIKEHKGTA